MQLLRAIGLGRRWVDALLEGTVADVSALAKREQKTEGVSRLVDLPAAFADQWAALGLTRPEA